MMLSKVSWIKQERGRTLIRENLEFSFSNFEVFETSVNFLLLSMFSFLLCHEFSVANFQQSSPRVDKRKFPTYVSTESQMLPKHFPGVSEIFWESFRWTLTSFSHLGVISRLPFFRQGKLLRVRFFVCFQNSASFWNRSLKSTQDSEVFFCC